MAYHEIDGALFRDEQRPSDGKRYPVMHLALEVLGVKMQVAVWPGEKSAKGAQYWPCSGSYARGETRRLVPVAVQQLPTAAPAAPVDAPNDGGAADADCPL